MKFQLLTALAIAVFVAGCGKQMPEPREMILINDTVVIRSDFDPNEDLAPHGKKWKVKEIEGNLEEIILICEDTQGNGLRVDRSFVDRID